MKMSLEGWAWRILIEAVDTFFWFPRKVACLLRIAAMSWLRLLAVVCTLERFGPMYYSLIVCRNICLFQ
jgi:hypothetical protein